MAIFSPLRPTTSPAKPPATSKTHASNLRHSRISFCLVLSSASNAYTPCITSAQQLDFRSELAYTPHRRIKVFCTAMNKDWILSLSLNKHTTKPALILLLLSLQSLSISRIKHFSQSEVPSATPNSPHSTSSTAIYTLHTSSIRVRHTGLSVPSNTAHTQNTCMAHQHIIASTCSIKTPDNPPLKHQLHPSQRCVSAEYTLQMGRQSSKEQCSDHTPARSFLTAALSPAPQRPGHTKITKTPKKATRPPKYGYRSVEIHDLWEEQ